MMKKDKPLFITFEGVEGCGKSTQVELLSEYLQGFRRKVFVTREPGGTAFGKRIRKILLHGKEDITPETETLLYMASRKELVKHVIKPKLEDGYVVICDRWLDATIAYQSYGSGVSRKWIESVAKEVVSGLKPDVTFWLDVPVKTGLSRAGKRADLDKIERRSPAFHNAVRSGYAALASRYKRIRRIAPAGIEATHRRIIKIIHEVY